PFPCAFGGNLLLDNFWTRDTEMLCEHCTHILVDIRHRIEVGHATDIEPMPNLIDTHAYLLIRNTLFPENIGHLIASEANQRRFRTHEILAWNKGAFHRGVKNGF